MKETIEAIYENGVLRPLRKLAVLEGQRIRLTVETADVEPAGTDGTGSASYDFSDLAGCLSSNPRFAVDPVAVQRELRDEWS